MISKKNILVTGANGQLGNECKVLSAHYKDSNFVFTDVEELSITDVAAIEEIFSKHNFDYCINAAAYTAVDNAEKEVDLSMAINATAVGYLADICKKYNCRLIHISTDYVFDGENSIGYNEDDATAPINVYGATKLEGENLALQLDPKSIVIRTSWVYSFYGKNFVKTMMKLMQEREEIIRVSGALEQHYSPRAHVFTEGDTKEGDGFIALADIPTPIGAIRIASPNSIEEFARILYQSLRDVDSKGLSRVKVIAPSGSGLADAIRDRLKRAAAGR